MAFVPEDGSGLSTATSYVSVADADTYHAAHGAPATWTAATDATKEAALMAATVWMDSAYQWRGDIATTTQALKWPRQGIVDADGRDVATNAVPQRVQDCCCYMALQHLSTALDAALARGGEIAREKVGPLEVEYAGSATPGTSFPYSRQIVATLLVSAGTAQVSLSRA